MLIINIIMPRIIILPFIVFILMTSPVYADNNDYQLDILSIHSYHQEYPWTSSQYDAFKKQLANKLPEYHFNFSTEYLDTKYLSPSAEYQKIFLRYLDAKYKDHIPDLIYVTDDNALNFIISGDRGLPWNVPVIYSGINNTEIDKSRVKQPLLGVFEYKDIRSSISLAKIIAPDASRIIFLGDGGTTDNAIKKGINVSEYKKDDVEIIFLSDSNLNVLINKLNTIDTGVVILTTVGGMHDSQGNLIDLQKIIKAITSTGRKILVMEDSYLLPGVIGGYLTTGRIQGETAANLASRIIRQELVSNIKNKQQNSSELILSWPELQRFNINLQKHLSNQAKIINQPPAFEKQYPDLIKWLLWFVLLLLIVLLGSIFNTRRKTRLLKEQYTDTITGLPNRIKLLHDINSAVSPNLIIIDINDFKSINHLYGLKVGDELLNNFGQKAGSYVGKNYSLYRVGGNQFAILNGNCKSPQQFDDYINNLLNKIQNNSYHIDQLDISLTLTAGISRNEREFLIPMAEQALQKAKDDNKDYYVCDIHEEETEQHHKNLLWAKKLSSALSDDRIVPYFQLITHNKTGKQDKFEALVRLIDEGGDVISPFFFLDVAKSTRQYASLTKVMIDKTLHSLQSLEAHGTSISINFTVDDIRDEKTIAFFKEKLNEYQVADRIIVELTEGEGIENYSEVSEFIMDIKKMGCRVAIDDFGTGYSNFTHLIHLNVDYLKIDGSIIQNIIKDKNAEIVAKTLVDFAGQLGIETIAEFVDSQEILDKVTELGIDYSQGYFLGKPESKLSI